MEHKSIKEQEVELIRELAHLEKKQEKQIDMILDTRTRLLRDQDAIKAYVAALDPREQNQVEYVNTKRKLVNSTGASTSLGCKSITFISRRFTTSSISR